MADQKAPEPVSSDDSCFIRFVGCPRSPVPLAEIRDKLYKFYRLHIVSEADRNVLEACATAGIFVDDTFGPCLNRGEYAIAEAELEARKTRKS